MANIDVENPDFSVEVEAFTTETPAHADKFNEKYSRFLKNDASLKKQVDDHEDTAIVTENGVHGFRFFEGKLQAHIYDEESMTLKWVTVPGSGIDYDGEKSVKGAIDELKGTIGFSNKNLLVFPYSERGHTDNGVEWSDDNIGTVFANGVATAISQLLCSHRNDGKTTLPKDTYIFSGCPKGGSDDTYYVQVVRTGADGGYEEIGRDYGDGLTFTLEEETSLGVSCTIANGYNANNITFKPMIRYASIEDDTYMPYVADVYTRVNRLYNVEEIEEATLVACKTDLTNVYTYTATKKCIISLSATAYYSNSIPKRIEIKKNGDNLLSANGFSTTTEILGALETTAFAILQKEETLKVYVGYQSNANNNIHLSGIVQYLE